MDAAIAWLTGLSPWLLYPVLGLGAALENVFPPVPADTFVLLGGFLAGRGRLDAWTVAGVTWACNVASALVVYGLGRRYGTGFFRTGVGRHALQPGQLDRMHAFYRRWGTPAIFLTRFLPAFRAVVPAFAGVTRQSFWSVALPLASASAIWYGALVWLGAMAGRNLETVLGWLSGANTVLLIVAGLLAVAVAVWWYRSRENDGRDDAPDGGD